MSFFAETMTVFNYDKARNVWHRNVIKGVQWSHDVRRVSASDGTIQYAKEESVSIDFGREYGNPVYVEPLVYEELPDKKGYWTLNVIDKKDIVVRGKAEECTEGSVLAFVRKRYPFYGIVAEVSDNRNRARLNHIEVVLKA